MLGHGTPEHAVDDPIEFLRHRMRHSAAHVPDNAARLLFYAADAKLNLPAQMRKCHACCKSHTGSIHR